MLPAAGANLWLHIALLPLPALQIVAHKVYLAVPSECPVGPDGKARKSSSQAMGGRTGAAG